MSVSNRVWIAVAFAGLMLGANLCAGDRPPPKEGDGPRIGPPDGGRGPGAREGREPRPPEGPPLLGDVKGMKEEIQKHQETMKELQDQIREVIGRPEDRKDRGDRKEDIGKRRADLQAKVDEVAPKIIDEFIRHHAAVSDLLKTNRQDAIEKLKEHMMDPPRPPDRRGEGPNPPFRRGERGDGPQPPDGRGEGRQARGERGEGPPPGGPAPMFEGVEAAKREMETHMGNMKALFDEVKAVVEAPRDRGGEDGPPDMAKARTAIFAKIDEVAPKIVAEFIRHFGSMKEAISANQDAAAEGLKKQMKQGHEDAVRRGGGPPGRRGGPAPEGDMRERKADF